MTTLLIVSLVANVALLAGYLLERQIVNVYRAIAAGAVGNMNEAIEQSRAREAAYQQLHADYEALVHDYAAMGGHQ